MITIFFFGGGGGSRAFWGGSFYPSNTLDRTLVYKCSKLSQRKPANRRRISRRRFSPSDFSLKLKPKNRMLSQAITKAEVFPGECVLRFIHISQYRKLLAIHRRLSRRFFLREARSKYISTGPVCTVSKGWYCFLAKKCLLCLLSAPSQIVKTSTTSIKYL